MVRAWYRIDVGLETESLMSDRAEFVSLEEVTAKTGVIFLKFNAKTWTTDTEYMAFKERRGYNYEDTCELAREAIPNFEQLVNNFSIEHIHADEEIRFVVGGSGYFDVRDWDDRWIRLEAGKDDLLILPAGIYHCFFLDSKEYIKVKRLFSGTPCWEAFYRPQADSHPSRKAYLRYLTELKQKAGHK